MEEPSSALINSTEGLEKQIYARLQDLSSLKTEDDTSEPPSFFWIILPLKITLCLPRRNKSPYVDLVQHLHLSQQQLNRLKQYAIMKHLSTEEAMSELVRGSIESHPNIQTIVREHSTKKKQVTVEVSLRDEMIFQKSNLSI